MSFYDDIENDTPGAYEDWDQDDLKELGDREAFEDAQADRLEADEHPNDFDADDEDNYEDEDIHPGDYDPVEDGDWEPEEPDYEVRDAFGNLPDRDW